MSFIWPLIATTSDDLQVLTVGVAALRAHGHANTDFFGPLDHGVGHDSVDSEGGEEEAGQPEGEGQDGQNARGELKEREVFFERA